MKEKFRHSLRRTIAFVSALTIVASVTAYSIFAENGNFTAEENVVSDAETVSAIDRSSTGSTKKVDDYTSLFPGITSPKLKLSDPVFTEKDWYEYIEYEYYTDVKDGDIIYRIYHPADYSAASIMAITDYDPKEVLGGTSSLTRNLGELQGVLDIAAQGGSISKEFVGLDLANGIASQMNSINEVMDNSKYYSSSSFLGIPGDKKYTGVTNDGYFNASSLEIEITETETVSACKTVAVDSSYSTSDVTENGKTSAKHVEVYDASSNTHDEQTYHEDTDINGTVIVTGDNKTTDSYNLTNTLTNEIKKEAIEYRHHTAGGSYENGVEEGIDFSLDGGASVTSHQTFVANYGQEWGTDTEVIVVPKSEHQTGTVKSNEHLDYTETNAEKTNMTGSSSGDSSTIEHALTSGNEDGVTYNHANEMAVNIGYGVDYQYGNEHSLSLGVTRTFDARDDKEVKNVGWKLCEYVVKIPYYIEAVQVDSTGEEKVLYGQYVNYSLLNGVSRVFANGYIEHWYTGELVTYADFFDGFITAQELVAKAQEQQKAKIPNESR